MKPLRSALPAGQAVPSGRVRLFTHHKSILAQIVRLRRRAAGERLLHVLLCVSDKQGRSWLYPRNLAAMMVRAANAGHGTERDFGVTYSLPTVLRELRALRADGFLQWEPVPAWGCFPGRGDDGELVPGAGPETYSGGRVMTLQLAALREALREDDAGHEVRKGRSLNDRGPRSPVIGAPRSPVIAPPDLSPHGELNVSRGEAAACARAPSGHQEAGETPSARASPAGREASETPSGVWRTLAPRPGELGPLETGERRGKEEHEACPPLSRRGSVIDPEQTQINREECRRLLETLRAGREPPPLERTDGPTGGRAGPTEAAILPSLPPRDPGGVR